MSSHQPLFFTANPERLPQFVLETRLWRDGDKFVAEKRAASAAASGHLRQLLANYQTIAAMTGLTRLVSVIPAAASAKTVRFNYVAGDSAERQLLEAVLADQSQAVAALIDKALSVVESLPAKKTNPAKSAAYVKVFGRTYNSITDCASPGLIDLNFDNFIIGPGGRWHLFDYEWLFDFAVPKLYLKQRLFCWFVIRHQEIFSYHARRLKAVAIADNVLVPASVYASFEPFIKDLSKCLAAEMAFQAYVTGRPSRRLAAIKLYKRVQRQPSLKLVGIDRVLAHESRAASLAEHAARLEERNQHLETELSYYRHSRGHQLLRKVGSVKRRSSRQKKP
ncbi:hypothetical protein HY380_01285 [Candidatus Saccharibacteria bacterium]|nr:hypothetical protein [Candidatus Saccharibacteria bacterium]